MDFLLIEYWVDKRNASITEIEAGQVVRGILSRGYCPRTLFWW